MGKSSRMAESSMISEKIPFILKTGKPLWKLAGFWRLVDGMDAMFRNNFQSRVKSWLAPR